MEAVIGLIEEDASMSRTAMATRLGISQSQVRTALDALKHKGRIHREGPDKGGKWIVTE